MNTQHLQYVVEIERMRSISQAAENLFIGQPNLSRILHDMEDTLGFKIFERTSRGVRPTERGTIFLQHAKSILREMDSIEALGPRRPVANRLRICIPRSAAMLDLTSEFIATLPEDQNLDVAIRECHARKALELLANGEVEIGIIRFRSEYRDYFEEQMTQRGLNFEILSKYRYQVLLCRNHPLAQKSVLQRSDLADLPEIVHGDTFRQSGQPDQHVSRKIYTVDRLAQLSLLEKIPNSYMWASAMPERCLRRWGFVQKICSDNQVVYHDAIAFNAQYNMSDIETELLEYIFSRYRR